MNEKPVHYALAFRYKKDLIYPLPIEDAYTLLLYILKKSLSLLPSHRRSSYSTITHCLKLICAMRRLLSIIVCLLMVSAGVASATMTGDEKKQEQTTEKKDEKKEEKKDDDKEIGLSSCHPYNHLPIVLVL